jgi:hypothetical protein
MGTPDDDEMLTPDEAARKAKLLKDLRHLEAVAHSRRARGFADIKNPEDAAKMQRFQQVFGKYFPRLLRNERAAVYVEQSLWDGIFGNPIQTINKSTFEADLKRFRAAVQELADWPIWGTMVYVGDIPIVSPEFRDSENPLHAAIEIYELLLVIGDLATNKTLSQVLDQLANWAREASEELPDRRNINWMAVNAVHHLRAHWESENREENGIESRWDAPRRALNPASPFADYLRDAFEFFNISGDPLAAFKRWVVVEDSFRERRIAKLK